MMGVHVVSVPTPRRGRRTRSCDSSRGISEQSPYNAQRSPHTDSYVLPRQAGETHLAPDAKEALGFPLGPLGRFPRSPVARLPVLEPLARLTPVGNLSEEPIGGELLAER
jgi:hypothetical protein